MSKAASKIEKMTESTIVEPFEQWNMSQDEKYRIQVRSDFTREFPVAVFGPRETKPIIKNDNGVVEKIENAFCKLEAKEKNGQKKGYYVNMPTVISRRGFKTNIVKGKPLKSIAITLFRSNPDHKLFIDNMLELQFNAAKHVIANKDLNPPDRDPKEVIKKFSILFRYEKDVDGFENKDSEKVYFYLNPLDFHDEEKQTDSIMKFYLPYQDEKGKWMEATWDDLLDKPYGFELIPKIKIMKLFHGNGYSLTIKCVSCVINRLIDIEHTAAQEETLRIVSENELNRAAIMEKFGALKNRTIEDPKDFPHPSGEKFEAKVTEFSHSFAASVSATPSNIPSFDLDSTNQNFAKFESNLNFDALKDASKNILDDDTI